MKLQELVNESAPKEDDVRKKRAAKATDLGSYAQAVWNAKGLEDKRKSALTFVGHMTAGKRETYRTKVEQAKTPGALDSLVSNVMLSGEGKGTRI
jgi:hypothetical protein